MQYLHPTAGALQLEDRVGAILSPTGVLQFKDLIAEL